MCIKSEMWCVCVCVCVCVRHIVLIYKSHLLIEISMCDLYCGCKKKGP